MSILFICHGNICRSPMAESVMADFLFFIQYMKRILGSAAEDRIHRLLDFTRSPRDVADPWYTDDFDTTYEDIVAGCTTFLSKI